MKSEQEIREKIERLEDGLRPTKYMSEHAVELRRVGKLQELKWVLSDTRQIEQQ